jgi:hypothetical protein
MAMSTLAATERPSSEAMTMRIIKPPPPQSGRPIASRKMKMTRAPKSRKKQQ